MKNLLLAVSIFQTTLLCAQYVSPDQSLNLTLDDLVANSDGAVIFSDDTYEIYENITISESDTLILDNAAVVIDEDVLITIEGGFYCNTTSFTQLNCCEAFYEGFRFEETAVADIFNSTFLYGGGIQVLTGAFRMEASTVGFQSTGQTTGAALDFSTGKPEVINCTFLQNETAAIGSAANADAAPFISGCTFNGNVTGNTNRPQVNLGPSSTDTTFVINNIFQGNPTLTNVGGFAFSLLVGGEGHVVFEGNTVFDNRYGMTIFGANVTSLIQNNNFFNNDTQGDPMLGGSGISITGFGENEHVISGNSFTGNLWGVTLLTEAQANLGEIDNPDIGPGGNFFDNNGNGGQIFALFNNTENEIFAQGNCWIASDDDLTLEEAEGVISHVVDDPALGEVIFDPLGSCSTVGTRDENALNFELYPNPSTGNIIIETREEIDRIEVYDLKGRLMESFLPQGRRNFDFSEFDAGIYLIKVYSESSIGTNKLLLTH